MTPPYTKKPTDTSTNAERETGARALPPLTEQRIRAAELPPSLDAEAHDRASPEGVLTFLALCAIEVIAGARELDQLGRWVTREVYEHLAVRVSIASRARRLRGALDKRPVVLSTRVSVFETSEGVVDGVVTVAMRDRTRAVAIRLEWKVERWRASAIHVL